MFGDTDEFSQRLLAWYDASRRDLPWRIDASLTPGSARPSPYHVMVSEAMLQQTQVATVIPYFRRFIERFPTIAYLAAADEQDVLRLWQGLGYYSRARNLRKAARFVVDELGGELPPDVAGLLRLPGVGRYTAGAIASIAFETRAPIVDGNVARVLCRVDRILADPRERAVVEMLWARAEQILPAERLGDFNSSLMELGATVCIPRSPQCLICPVREHCEAYAAGVQNEIPPARKAKATPLERRWTFIVRRTSDDAFLVEQRPATGRWAGMWQFVTVSAVDGGLPGEALGVATSLKATPPRGVGEVTHALTHRRYAFTVFACAVEGDGGEVAGREWATLAMLAERPMSKPQLRVAGMARELLG